MVTLTRSSAHRALAGIAAATLVPLAVGLMPIASASGEPTDPGTRRVEELSPSTTAQLVRVTAPTPSDRSRVVT